MSLFVYFIVMCSAQWKEKFLEIISPQNNRDCQLLCASVINKIESTLTMVGSWLRKWAVCFVSFAFLFFLFFCFLDKSSLYSPGCLGTHFVNEVGLPLTEICVPLSARIKSMCYHCWLRMSTFYQKIIGEE